MVSHPPLHFGIDSCRLSDLELVFQSLRTSHVQFCINLMMRSEDKGKVSEIAMLGYET
jgi:hypothetical protein